MQAHGIVTYTCSDPDRFPYKNLRAYTPRSAPLDTLIQNLLTKNVMLVQATIEKSFEDLLEKLKECRSSTLGFSGLVRGTILAEEELFDLTNDGFRKCILLVFLDFEDSFAIEQDPNMTIIDMITALYNPWTRYAFTFLVVAGTFGVYSTTYT
jgi:hypothetical protein